MKIVFFEVQNWEKQFLKKSLKEHKLEFFDKPLNKNNAKKAKSADIVGVFIYSKLKKEVIKELKKTKLIVTKSTGFDHIDLKECRKRKITVCNVPTYGENTLAEHAFALILAPSRNLHKSYVRTLKSNYSIQGLKGFDLKGKTLGVIGAGHIGLHVIRIAKGFGMNVLVYDINQDKFLSEVLGYKYSPLEKLLKNSDIISLHVPHNKHTHHMINKKTIKFIKKGALLINTSRGEVIDTDALLEALDKKILSGAGLDVIEGEELIKEEKQLLHEKQKTEVLARIMKDHIILSKDNVVFTPHIAFYSKEALERILETTIQNINAFISGKPQNTV
jgi:D-lactate dehydrogenase